MSEHSDDGFDRYMQEEELETVLLKVCERNGKGCRWQRNDEGMLECRTCGKVVDE